MNTIQDNVINNPSRQRGTALLTALMILVAVTVVSLASLGTSLMELRMSGNDELTMQSFQQAQAALDDVINKEDQNFIVAGGVGDIKCTTNMSTGCTTYDLVLGAAPGASFGAPFAEATHTIQIERTSDEICPPRSKENSSSCDKVKAANFNVVSSYNSAGAGASFGKTSLAQGYIKLLPATGSGLGSAPETASQN